LRASASALGREQANCIVRSMGSAFLFHGYNKSPSLLLFFLSTATTVIRRLKIEGLKPEDASPPRFKPQRLAAG
jgi:hypothetical protein